MRKLLMVGLLAVFALDMSACTHSKVIPEQLKSTIKLETKLNDVLVDSLAHRGEVVVWGGEVREVVRLNDITRIEIQQMPLDREFAPLSGRAKSDGRFFVYDSDGVIIDPTGLRPGTHLTIIGSVIGSVVGSKVASAAPLGASDVPSIKLLDMTVWSEQIWEPAS